MEDVTRNVDDEDDSGDDDKKLEDVNRNVDDDDDKKLEDVNRNVCAKSGMPEAHRACAQSKRE